MSTYELNDPAESTVLMSLPIHDAEDLADVAGGGWTEPGALLLDADCRRWFVYDRGDRVEAMRPPTDVEPCDPQAYLCVPAETLPFPLTIVSIFPRDEAPRS